MGKGHVTVTRNGRESTFPAGQTLEISELGSYQQPDPATGIPAEIWDHVLRARGKAQQQKEKEAAPSQEILSLLEQRTTARARKDNLVPMRFEAK